MAFVKTIPVRLVGHSRAIWLDKSWKVRAGDMLVVRTIIAGQSYVTTTVVKKNCSPYVLLPRFWPLEKGDVHDFTIDYATVPKSPHDDEESTNAEQVKTESEKVVETKAVSESESVTVQTPENGILQPSQQDIGFIRINN